MKSFIEKIEIRQDENDIWVELRIKVIYQPQSWNPPNKENFVYPFMFDGEGKVRECYREDYKKQMQKYLETYLSWEKREKERIEHNNAMAALQIGAVDLKQGAISPAEIRARPAEIADLAREAT